MNKSKTPVLIALAVALAASACLVMLPAPAAPPAVSTPDLAMTGKAQALTAAPTIPSTATLVLETALPTLTLTSFPTITPLPTATATFTATPYGFVASPTLGLPLPTGEETPDPAEGATDDWGSDYRCALVSKDPLDWGTVEAKAMYRASWTLRNAGKKTWQADGIEVTHIDGLRLGAVKVISLSKDVKVGSSIKTAFNIVAPKEPGRYRSVWGLRLKKNSHVFCTFTLKIDVP